MGDYSDIFRPGSRPGGEIPAGASVYFVGIKGTGVCALAELMLKSGMKVRGSDINEEFYTDAILKELGVPYFEGFDSAHIGDDIDLVIHSAAYTAEDNPELAAAMEKNIPLLKYPDALGEYSSLFDSAGIAGVHGKTTTTAMCGCLMRGLGLPARILVGSAVSNFNGRSTIILGDKYFIAETCEYREHFLSFRPKRIVLTSVESDQQDFFPTYEAIRDTFIEYCRLIPPGGELIYCADDPGASEVANIIKNDGKGIVTIPYGFTAAGRYKICSYRVEDEKTLFAIDAFEEEFCLRIPGRHEVLDATAALVLASVLVAKEFPDAGCGWNKQLRAAARKSLEEFTGSKRRSEIIGVAGGILFMDDYGHHPTAIKTTLKGLKDFYPSRRLVVSFMSHTYSRTAALLDEFADALCAADVLILHKIYASARERFDGKITGKDLYDKVISLRGTAEGALYADEIDDAFEPLKNILKPGDLFLTLGAGNNWPLGIRLFEYYRGHGVSL